MAGETELSALLRDLNPSLDPETYVFCTAPGARYGDLAETQPLATVAEAEGLTLVLTQQAADQASLSYEGTFRCVTLTVHSSLEAVGLTAAVSGELSRHGISAPSIRTFSSAAANWASSSMPPTSSPRRSRRTTVLEAE